MNEVISISVFEKINLPATFYYCPLQLFQSRKRYYDDPLQRLTGLSYRQ